MRLCFAFVIVAYNRLTFMKSVKKRLQSESGISFTEFSYQLIQAYDFYHLHLHAGCTVQIGGSDQWGNIQSGIEMIRREAFTLQELAEEGVPNEMKGNESAYGLMFPLLITASGEKFGKSAGNAVWLDEALTSPYELYQVSCRLARQFALD